MSNSTVPLGWGRYWSSILMCHPNTMNSPRCSALLGRAFSLAYPVNACWCSTEQLKCRLSHWTTRFPTVEDIHLPPLLCFQTHSHGCTSTIDWWRGNTLAQHTWSKSQLWHWHSCDLGQVTFLKWQFQVLHMQKGHHNAGLWFLIWDLWDHLHFEIQIFMGGGELTFSERYFSGNTDYVTPSAGSRTALWNQTHKYPCSKIYEYSH